MNDSSAKPLIIGFATNQDPTRVAIFAKSLRQIYPSENCDVVLGINQPEVFDICCRFGFYPVPSIGEYKKSQSLLERCGKHFVGRALSALLAVGGPSPFLRGATNAHFESTLHPHLARWFFYRRTLGLFPNSKKILITDISDVFFQAPFFKGLQEDRLYFFAESNNYGNSKWNDDNYLNLYGRKEHNAIWGKPVLCMGVCGGGARLIEQLINWMVESVYAHAKGGSDQVRGNRFFHLESPNGLIEAQENGSDIVLHIHKAELLDDGDPSIAHLKDNRIVAKQGDKIIPIVHMYNRQENSLKIAKRFLPSG